MTVWIISSQPSVLNVFSENIFCLGVPSKHFLQYIQTQHFYIWYFLQCSCCTRYTSMFSYSTEAALDQYFQPFFSPFQISFIWSFPLSWHYHLDGASNLYSHQQWRHANTSWDQMQYKHIPSIHWTAATSQLTPASISITLSIICIWKSSLAIKGINCWCSCIEAKQLLSWSV